MDLRKNVCVRPPRTNSEDWENECVGGSHQDYLKIHSVFFFQTVFDLMTRGPTRASAETAAASSSSSSSLFDDNSIIYAYSKVSLHAHAHSSNLLRLTESRALTVGFQTKMKVCVSACMQLIGFRRLRLC